MGVCECIIKNEFNEEKLDDESENNSNILVKFSEDEISMLERSDIKSMKVNNTPAIDTHKITMKDFSILKVFLQF